MDASLLTNTQSFDHHCYAATITAVPSVDM